MRSATSAGAFLVLLCAVAPADLRAQELRDWRGGPTPALELQDLKGRPHRLSDYRGRVVLVNFWASWCAPCRAEMPSIERLRVSLAGEPFAVLAVNVGEDAGTIERFARSIDIGFALLLDRDTRVTRAWGARALPASFVIDPAGRIRYSYLGDLDWSAPAIRDRMRALMPLEGPNDASRAGRAHAGIAPS